MTITLDSVPAKLNELDVRAPLEVFEAIEAAIRERADLWSRWQAERCFRAKAEAELLRLTDDCARLVDCINAQPPTRRSLIDRAERAEAELASLRAKIADAPITQVTRMAAIGGGGYEWAGCRVPDEWNAKLVRLVVEE